MIPVRLTPEDHAEIRENHARLNRERRSRFGVVTPRPREPWCIPSYRHAPMPEFFEPIREEAFTTEPVDGSLVLAFSPEEKVRLVRDGYWYYAKAPGFNCDRWVGNPPRRAYPPLLRPVIPFDGVYGWFPGVSVSKISEVERLSPARKPPAESVVDKYLRTTETYKKSEVYGDEPSKVILQIRRDAIMNAVKADDAVTRLRELGVSIKPSAWKRMISRDRASIKAAERNETLSVLTKAGLLKFAEQLPEGSQDFLSRCAYGLLPREGRTETIENFKRRHQEIFADGHFVGFQREQFAKGWLARKVTGDPEKEDWKPESRASVAMSDGYRVPGRATNTQSGTPR